MVCIIYSCSIRLGSRVGTLSLSNENCIYAHQAKKGKRSKTCQDLVCSLEPHQVLLKPEERFLS